MYLRLPRSHSAAVLIGLGANFGPRATWLHRSCMPFVTNLADLAVAPTFQDLHSHHILLNNKQRRTHSPRIRGQ